MRESTLLTPFSAAVDSVVQAAQPDEPQFLRDSAPSGSALPECSPEGDCAFERLVR